MGIEQASLPPMLGDDQRQLESDRYRARQKSYRDSSK